MRMTPHSQQIPPLLRVGLTALLLLFGGCEGSAVVGISGDGGMDASLDVSCSAGQSACSGACVDTRGSALHCGACGNACSPGNLCVNGACMPSCPGMQTLCNGNLCVSTGTDRAHCGRCGNTCMTGQVCSNGRCDVECAPGLRPARRRAAPTRASTAARGPRYCADPQTDRANRGACGNAPAPAGTDLRARRVRGELPRRADALRRRVP